MFRDAAYPGKSMYESDDIVKYLFSNYGDGQVPWGLSLGIFTALSCGLALIPRYALLSSQVNKEYQGVCQESSQNSLQNKES